MKKHLRMGIRATISWLVLGMAVLAVSCGSAPDQTGIPQSTPLATDFIQLEPGSAQVEADFPGMIEGSVNVDIKAQVTGYLESIFVNEGDYVHQGQPLFKIRSDLFNEQVNNNNAALQSALAAQHGAKLELEKVRPLVEAKIVSQIQLSTAVASYDAATAQVAQAKAAVASSKINAGFALIKAPVSGYIGRIPNRIGNLVTSGDAAPLTSLSAIDHVNVYFSMSEADYLSYTKAQTINKNVTALVQLVTADGALYPHKGQLMMASGNIDKATGSATMKAVFPNPDKLLRSGGAGRIVLFRQLDKVLKIPMTSVKDIQDKFFVFRLADSSKVAMTAIDIAGRSGGSYLVIPTPVLKEHDKIAISRLDALDDRMQVTPEIRSVDSLSK